MEETRCDDLLRKSGQTLMSMMNNKIATTLNQTGKVVKNEIIDIQSSKEDYTRHQKGLGVVYTGEPKNPTSYPQVRDVFELANKDRPFICRANRGFGKQNTIDCFSLDDQLGTVIRDDLKHNREAMRELIIEARERVGTADRKQWTNWERALFRELMDERNRLKYVLGATTDSAGHKYPTGPLTNMVVEECHALSRPGK